MVRALVVILVCLSVSDSVLADYTPPPAAAVQGYTATELPCKIDEAKSRVSCAGDLLENKSLRELSILRNTIYARWGWDGFKKAWLRNYFHAQPWFHPNPKFTYRVLSDIDRKNAHYIGAREQSLTSAELEKRRQAIVARGGQGAQGALSALSPEDKIELGLLTRARGGFATDDASANPAPKESPEAEASLDRLLALAELRQLSQRDLRLLRNTIYARRGRAFKSPILRDHFLGMDWYKVDPAYSDKLLSKTDSRNIALIKSVENENGGPINDEGMLTEPATDGA